LALFWATCVLSEAVFALDADWLVLSVLGVVAAVAEVLSVEVVLVADWLVLGVVFAAAVLSEVLGVVLAAELLEVLVCGGTAWFDIVLAVDEP
jgi:hypothetical protein